MRIALLPALVLVAATAAAEERRFDLSGFDGVAIEGAADVVATAGPAFSVTVATSARMLERLELRVEDGTLVVDTRDGGWFEGSDPVRVTVSAPALRRFRISGSGTLSATEVAGGEVAAAISGSGTMTLSGRCASLDASIAGSGEVQAQTLLCASAAVAISGSGDAAVHATDRAAATISGSGAIVVHGSPGSVQQSVTGSGEVTVKP